MAKYVYSFNEGSRDMRALLGGKGANLAEMTNIGLPVPFGFTITTDVCRKYSEDGGVIDQAVIDEVWEHIAELEEVMGKKFGDNENPLLVSVRSGAPVSMPGMMDTILNLGLNDVAVEGLAKKTGNDRFAYDSYRRFIQMFGDVVMEIRKSNFDAVFEGQKKKAGALFDVELTTDDLKEVIKGYKEVVRRELGREFPQEPKDQLLEAIKAVFRSWNNDRAILYRKLNGISDSLGTAVNVQAMVFGNSGNNSGTGVAFTRNPATGENKLFGEFLVNAQGEDVVAGIRTPQPISEMADAFPEVYAQFAKIADTLESHYRDMQDMEFTVEDRRLFMLQTRNGKRTAAAAVKVAVDLVKEGLIDKETAVMRVEPDQINQLLHPVFDAEELGKAIPVTKGLPASPGAATGQIVFSADDAAKFADAGKKVILVREETSPEDLAGMVAAEGILTARGGMTSHAAVVARGMGKCCVAGCKDIIVDEAGKTLTIGGKEYHEGDSISLNGSDGNVYAEAIKTLAPELSGDFGQIMEWADEARTLKIRTNADNPRDAAQAVAFGAEGIGLCRTEHMFFEDERIPKIRRMILADTEEERREALAGLLPYQKDDFKGIYGIPYEKIVNKTLELHEMNPMLGHRGCRLAITYPEIVEMQAEAIISAALEVRKEDGLDIIPEIMVPLVGFVNELKYVKKIIVEVADKLIAESGEDMKYLVGTMIEIPRAAITADEIAEEAEFFSFGTNDLTQMGLGFSRDDTGNLVKEYIARGIIDFDPFQSLDQSGVGKLVKVAVDGGRRTRPNIKLGICGEHGGDPATIFFCHNVGLNYVSCSPFRVPIARLAAAQAAIKDRQRNQNA